MRQERAFTLIEVLVALTILAIALGAAVRAVGATAQTQEQLRLRLLATWTAENRMAEHLALRHFPNLGVAEGETTMGGEPLRWRETVMATPNTHFRRLELQVISANGDELARLTSVLGAP